MRAVVQRVREATVVVAGQTVGSIPAGLLIYLGVSRDDLQSDTTYTADKILNLRVFPDESGTMNLSILDLSKRVIDEADVGILAISQFTLYGDTRKGRRPSYNQAAPPQQGKQIFDAVVDRLRKSGLAIATGRFGAHMDVTYTNDGPVTVLIDSQKQF